MKNFRHRPYFKYSFIPALGLVTAGIVAGLLTQQWNSLYLGLIIIGSVFLIIWLINCGLFNQKIWQQRSTQAGTNALIATVSVIIILGLINFVAVRYSKPIDLTENQLFTLSTQSQKVVKSLDKPTKVWIFDQTPDPSDQELLENYRRYNSQFTFEYINPDQNLGKVKEFGVKSLGDVYVEYGQKKQLVQTLIEFEQKQPLSEIKLTNALEKVQRNYIPTAYILQGHGESSLSPSQNSLSQAVDSLKEKGYQVNGLEFAKTSTIPQDADIVIIAHPKGKLFPQEITALQNYLDQGGSLLLLLEANTETGLEPLLNSWGVSLDPRLIIDPSRVSILDAGGIPSFDPNPAIAIISSYGDHPITKELTNRYTLYYEAYPVATSSVEGVNAVSLVVSNDQMWGESDLSAAEITLDPTVDLSSPFDLAVALERKSQKTSADNNEAITAKMIVFGDATFATDEWFNQQFNGDLLLNSVQWLTSGEKEPLSIRPKQPENRRVNLTPLQAGFLAWLSLIVMPLLGLVMAGIMWWRRR